MNQFYTSLAFHYNLFNPVDKSNTGNSKFLVFLTFVKTSKKVLSLVTPFFDLPSLPPFCVTSCFEWRRGPIENTAKVESFVYIFWRLCNSTYIFLKSYHVIPPNHSSRRVLCILYLHIVDVWGREVFINNNKHTIIL